MCAMVLNPVMHQSPVASAPAAAELAAPQIACVLVTPYGVPTVERLELAASLRAQCERLTDQIVWLGQRGQEWPDGALLDLGDCSASEAQAACERLLTWLLAQRLIARIGIGPTETLARLVALRAASGVVRVVEHEQARSFLQRLPVDALSGLSLEGLTPALVARLRQDGLRTLGQVAELDERDPLALRRQFGAVAGARLAMIAQGNAPCPLEPTHASAAMPTRRCSSGASQPGAARLP